jgi:uncharacterized protein YndB with AHSA1/START domain
MSVAAIPAVLQSVIVNVPIERAFDVFTGKLDSWWPLETHHIGEQPAQTAIVEPRAGGRWYERAADGTECDWGQVRVWEPPHRVVFSWQLNEEWQYFPELDRASEIEVRFFAETESSTRVELEHRNLERHGGGADAIRTAVSGPGGWPSLLELFQAAVEN